VLTQALMELEVAQHLGADRAMTHLHDAAAAAWDAGLRALWGGKTPL
jgi:hypothetical protein